MNVEQTVNDLRLKIVENRKNGLPADHGINRDTLRDAIRTLRSSRTLDISKTTAGKTTKKAAAKKPILDKAALDGLLGI